MAQRDEAEATEARRIGVAVEYVRDAARLTQDQLAELVGVSKNTIYNIEKGKEGSGWNLQRLQAIAKACAGKGWLPNDHVLIRRFITGDEPSIPLEMRLPFPYGDGGSPRSNDLNSDPGDGAMGGSRSSHTQLVVVSEAA